MSVYHEEKNVFYTIYIDKDCLQIESRGASIIKKKNVLDTLCMN